MNNNIYFNCILFNFCYNYLKPSNPISYMTIKSIRTNLQSPDSQTSPSRFNHLSKKTKSFNQDFKTSPSSKKTDIKVRKKLELESSSINKKKRDFNTVFPASPDASSENKRIAKIAFPISPMKGQNLPFVRSELKPSVFAIPQQIERVSAGEDAVVRKNRSLSTSSLPQPNFSQSWAPQFRAPESKSVQATPVKKIVAVSRLGTAPVISPFQKQHEALLTNTFKYNVTYLAKGSFSNVYTLEGNENPIIAGVSNSDLVLKAYHGENSGFSEGKLRAFLRNQIQNYHAAVNAGLPVAKIYNADTAVQDGYIIQQKVSGKINPLDVQQLSQVSRFFDVAVKKELLMDLQAQNFALENDQVILIDFIEDPEEEDELHPFNKKVMEESWLKIYRKAGLTKEQAAAFLNILSANHYQKFIQELLK